MVGNEPGQVPGGFQLPVLGQHDGAGVEQGGGALQQKGVKAHAAQGENRPSAVDAFHGLGQVQQGPAGDLHPLGLARGARGVHHVGQVRPTGRTGRLLGGRGQLVRVHSGQQRGEGGSQGRGSHQGGGLALLQNGAHPPLGQVGGEQQKSSSCPQNSHHGGKEPGGAGQQKGNQSIGLGAEGGEGGVEAGGLLLQLAVGDRFLVLDQGDAVGELLHTPGKAGIKSFGVQGPPDRIEGIDHLFLLGRGQQGQLADGTVGLGQGLAQQMDQAAVEGLDLPRGEELGEIVVVHQILYVAGEVAEMDAQLFHLIAAVVPAAGEVDGGVLGGEQLAVLIGQGDVEQPLAVPTLLPGQLLDTGEGAALVAQQAVPGIPQMAAELFKGPVAVHLSHKGQGADKHAAGLLGAEVQAVIDGDADGEGVPHSKALEIDGQGHIKHGEGGDAVFQAEGGQAAAHVLGQLDRNPPPHGADGRAAARLQGGGGAGPGEDLPPVGLVLGQGGGGQVALLLLHVAGIAGNGVQRRLTARQQVQIGLPHPVAQQGLGPAVGDEVVHFHHQTAPVLPGAQQDKAAEGSVQQGQGLPGEGLHPAVGPLLLPQGEVIYRNGGGLVGGLILHGDPVPQGDAGVEGGIGRQDQVDAALEGREVHRALEVQRGTDMVNGGAGAGLFQGPDVLLAQGEGEDRGRHRFQRNYHLPREIKTGPAGEGAAGQKTGRFPGFPGAVRKNARKREDSQVSPARSVKNARKRQNKTK